MLAAALLLVLGAAPSAGGQSSADVPTLSVSSGSFDGGAYATMSVFSERSIADVSVFVPQGYSLDLGRPAGAEVGQLIAFLEDPVGGGFVNLGSASLTVDEPAKYASDSSAQSCAPGVHAAVWKATLAGIGGRALDLPIFVDPTGPGHPPGTAYVLRACPVWPSTEVGVAHRTTSALLLGIEQGVGVPTAPGRYQWQAVVTPTGPGSIVAEPSRTFELRATVAFPRVLTLRATHERKAKTVLLSGKLTAVGQPEPGAPVVLLATDPDTGSVEQFGPVTTNAGGDFRIRRRVIKTTQYTAGVAEDPEACTAPSSAPAGCVSETVAAPLPVSAAILIRKQTDPKLAVRARDRALARRAGLVLSDFPEGWDSLPLVVPVDLCLDLEPDLSALTATGEAHSRVFLTQTAAAASSTTVYATVAESRSAFRKEAQLAVARCIANDAREESGTIVHGVGTQPFPRAGDETRAFRVVIEDDDDIVYVDLISFRRGRVVVHAWVSSLFVPLDLLERELLAKLAARARGS